jgi:protein-S-isoprenylcysteine O-methyltransferase Ste14
MALETIELWVERIGAVAGFSTLIIVVLGFRRLEARPKGRVSGGASRFLRWPFLLTATILYVMLGVFLWRPLPLSLSPSARLIGLLFGTVLYFPGLALYLWGYRTLGTMFGVSSGFGVQLYATHQLITHGPYAIIRHPMYLAVMIAGWGGLMIYRTWAMALFALSMVGLMFRAHQEEETLAAEFGPTWEIYSSRVPA